MNRTAVMRILVAMAIVLAGCAAPGVEDQTSPAAASVICGAFAPGGAVDAAADAAGAEIRGENPAVRTRDAVSWFLRLATHASGEEQSDLELVAKAMNDAAMRGEGFVGWDPAYEAFYAKYAERCGREIAD